MRRLADFLDADELQGDARELVTNAKLQLGDEVLAIENGEFCWSKEASQPTLEDINLAVRKGDLVGILGRVGAGKSSLLSAIIGGDDPYGGWREAVRERLLRTSESMVSAMRDPTFEF